MQQAPLSDGGFGLDGGHVEKYDEDGYTEEAADVDRWI